VYCWLSDFDVATHRISGALSRLERNASIKRESDEFPRTEKMGKPKSSVLIDFHPISFVQYLIPSPVQLSSYSNH
jgi:hypothetical protein